MKHMSDSKRGRKRALSTTGLGKNLKNQNPQKIPGVGPKPKLVKGKGRALLVLFYILIYFSFGTVFFSFILFHSGLSWKEISFARHGDQQTIPHTGGRPRCIVVSGLGPGC